MARIKDSSVEAVKQAADFVAVVEDRTALRKQGARLVGRCPFHDERTPSFSVNPVDKFYYCFGCGAKGDLITFVRDTQGLDFVGAIEWLADRFRIPLEYEESSPEAAAQRDRRTRLYELLDDATSYYERILWEAEVGSFARDYLKGRGFSEEIAREFRLGFSLGGNALSRKALSKGFSREELQAAGLSRGPNDYFQRRLMFPLADARGRVLGFQARKLYEDDPMRGKYVNTSESELFHKSAVVYGLDKARATIAKEDRAIVVEGNADVIALHQAGLRPVVASMGTALTEQQLRELARLTKRLWLAFDGDAAGETATLRGMDLAVKQGFDVNVVALPSGLDPADDPGGFSGQLDSAQPYVLYRVQVELARAEDREAGFRRAKEILDGFPEGPDKLAAQRIVSDYVGTTVQFRTGAIPTARTLAWKQRTLDAGARLEHDALAGVIAHPQLRPYFADLGPEHFYEAEHRAIRAHLVDGTPLDDAHVGLFAELDARAEAAGIDEATAKELLARLRERELRRQLRTAEPAQAKELQEMLTRLLERAVRPA